MGHRLCSLVGSVSPTLVFFGQPAEGMLFLFCEAWWEPPNSCQPLLEGGAEGGCLFELLRVNHPRDPPPHCLSLCMVSNLHLDIQFCEEAELSASIERSNK